jgi:uncharacterized protein
MIENRFVLIRRGDAVLAVAGLGDFTENRSGIDAIPGIPPEATLIVLAHNPDSAEMDHRRRVDLYICGHTHGGQVRIPLADYAPVLPVTNRHLDAGIRRTRRGEQVFISRESAGRFCRCDSTVVRRFQCWSCGRNSSIVMRRFFLYYIR